ncbi:MAG: hypothetical protein J5809_08100 [Selenomonadaceae bacterium]|nr:hypothetical protein [Selenomonadaceae bacterium]
MNFSQTESDIRKFKDLGVLLGRAGNRDTAALKRAFALFGIDNFGDGRYKFNGAEISNDAAWQIILDQYKGGYLPTTR